MSKYPDKLSSPSIFYLLLENSFETPSTLMLPFIEKNNNMKLKKVVYFQGKDLQGYP